MLTMVRASAYFTSFGLGDRWSGHGSLPLLVFQPKPSDQKRPRFESRQVVTRSSACGMKVI